MKEWQKFARLKRFAPRVRRALVRISREKYLMPKEVCEIGRRLCECKSFNWHRTFEYAVDGSWTVYGMWKGQAPKPQNISDQYQLEDAIKKAEKKQEKGIERDSAVELVILKQLIRRMRYGN